MKRIQTLSLEKAFWYLVCSILLLIVLVLAVGLYGYYANKHRAQDNQHRIADIAQLRIESRLQSCREINKIRTHLRRAHLRRAISQYHFLAKHPSGIDGISTGDIERGIATEIAEIDSFASIDCDYYARHTNSPTRYKPINLPNELLGYRNLP